MMFGTLRKGFEFLRSYLFRWNSAIIIYISLLMAVQQTMEFAMGGLKVTYAYDFPLVIIEMKLNLQSFGSMKMVKDKIESWNTNLLLPLVTASLGIEVIYPSGDPMKHIVKILSLLVALSAVWISLLQTSVLPASYTWLLPLYFIVSLGCYGLLMVGVGLMHFPTCPHEAILLQQDVIEAKEFLKGKGVDVGTD